MSQLVNTKSCNKRFFTKIIIAAGNFDLKHVNYANI